MRLPGICTECNRVTQVQVTGHALVMAQATGRQPRGICVNCQRKRDCRHTRTNDGERTVRCLDCNSWGRRNPRTGQVLWS